MANQDRKPVVLQVIPDLNTGGAERTTVDVARALVGAGWTALIVSEGGRLTDELDAIGAKHIQLPVKSKNPLTIWRNAARLQAVINEHSVDIIHARSRAPAWSAFRAAKRAKVPFVTTYHGIYGQNNPLKALYNSVMARGDTVIANSDYTARLIEERHAFAKGRITIIPRGSDLQALAPGAVLSERLQALSGVWGLSEGRPVVMNLARLTNWKGQGVLIDAMAQLAKAGDDKTIAVLAGDAQGREAYLAELKARIAKHGLTDRILLVGHCDDVPAALALADVSVVASIEPEAFGRAAVEAQAAHVPVIVSDLGAVPETVLAPPETLDEERTGWRVPPAKPQDLAAALRHVLDLEPKALKTLTTRAAAHVTRNFSVETMCARTLKVYQDLL